MRVVYRLAIWCALLTFSSSLVNATPQLIETRADDPVNTLLELFRKEKDPEQQVRITLTLAELSMKESPSASLQFLSLIEAKIGFNKQITPFLQYFKARSYAASGQYYTALEQLTLANEFIVPTDLHKKVMELQLDCFAQLNMQDKFIEMYEGYNRRYPLYVQLESLRQDAARLFLERGNQARHLQLVESLAEKYPLTESSRWALKTLETYTCEHDSKASVTRYHFPQFLLQRINWQSALDPGLDQWIAGQISRPIRMPDNKTKYLTAKEQIEWLLRLRKYDIALQKIKNETVLNKIPVADAGDFKILEGQAYQGLGDLRQALNIYQTTLSTIPKYWKAPVVQERIAYLYARLGHHETAAETFSALQRRIGKDKYRWLQFWFTYRSNNMKSALSLLQNVSHQQHPDRDPIAIKYWRARILEKMGNRPDAEKLLQQIASEAPHSFYTIMAVNKDKNLGRFVSKIPSIETNDEEAQQRDGSDASIEPDHDESEESSPEVETTTIVSEAPNKKLDDIKYTLAGVSGLHDWIMGLQSLTTRGGIIGDPSRGLKGLTETWGANDYPLAFYDIVEAEANKRRLDPHLLLSIIRAESRYRKDALSPVGALGLMQIMPFTALRIAEDLGDAKFQLNSLLDPQANIAYGAFYFGKLLHFYSDNAAVALAAYNAGPTVVGHWLESCRNCELDEFVDNIPYRETRNYVKKIIGYYSNYKRLHGNQQVVALQQQLPSKFDRSINIY